MPHPNPPDLTIIVAQPGPDRETCFTIRRRVFVEEQNVPEDLEYDDLDADAVHYLARVGEAPVGTARVVASGDCVKVGRVAVLPQVRGQGIGAALMEYLIEDAAHGDYSEAYLDAQTYALAFYERLGFAAEGDEFLEAGIPHYRMRRRLKS